MTTIDHQQAAVDSIAKVLFCMQHGLSENAYDMARCQGLRDAARREATNALTAAMPHIREHIAAEISDYWDACGDLIDSHNGARLAFDAVIDQIRTGSGE